MRQPSMFNVQCSMFNGLRLQPAARVAARLLRAFGVCGLLVGVVIDALGLLLQGELTEQREQGDARISHAES